MALQAYVRLVVSLNASVLWVPSRCQGCFSCSGLVLCCFHNSSGEGRSQRTEGPIEGCNHTSGTHHEPCRSELVCSLIASLQAETSLPKVDGLAHRRMRLARVFGPTPGRTCMPLQEIIFDLDSITSGPPPPPHDMARQAFSDEVVLSNGNQSACCR